MEALSHNLKRLMAYKNLNESELARSTGVAQPVIHRIAAGKTDNPKVASLSPLANYFCVSVDQLIGLQPLPPYLTEDKKLQPINICSYVPLLDWQQIDTWLTQPKPAPTNRKVITDVRVDPSSYALSVQDTTMRPRFPEGTIIIVDPTLQPGDRDFAIIKTAHDVIPTFKQVLYDSSRVYLKGLNPDFQGTYFDNTNNRFLGVIVQAKMNLRA